MGIFAETSGERFEMTDLAVPLRTDARSSLNAIARMYGEDWFWRPYGELFHSVTTGQSAFEHVHDRGFYDHVASDPEAARIFDDAMIAFTVPQARRLVQEYDFGRFGRIMDVGGGQGTLILEVLRAFPRTRGVLFDRSEVIRAAAERLAHLEAADRLELAGGDFMDELPSGCDAIVLRNVLQDWGDEEAQKLLTNCKRAMSRGGTLLVIGRLIEPGNDPYPGKFTDLTMMVLTGGRERTLEEHWELFARAGFAPGAVTKTSALCAIIEGRPL
jgi:ubiquinone/menaquinone biosynthesis C-methylase UbiE